MERIRAWLAWFVMVIVPSTTWAATTELLRNPGFESGPGQGWTEFSSGGYEIIGQEGSPHGGTWKAWFGGYADGVDRLSQQFTIPSDAQLVTASFWYQILTEETAGTAQDHLVVQVIDPQTGGALAHLVRLTNLNATNGWVQLAPVDISSLRGRTVRLFFDATTDSARTTSFHVDDVSVTATTAAAAAPATNLSDIWFNPSESGWGMTIADHETQLFAVWFTYLDDGSPTWFVIPGGTFSENRRIFTGDIYQTSGGARYDAPFDPATVSVNKVGSMAFDFAPPGLAPGVAKFNYRFTDGTVGSRQIERQPFGNGKPAWGIDLTDIWWNPAESGWGLTLAQHGDTTFGVWFTYDAQRRPTFFVLPSVTFAGFATWAGDVYTTTGPSYRGSTFDASRVRVTYAGNASIEAQLTGGRLRFGPVINGSAVSKMIEPQPFGKSPGGGTPAQTHALAVSFGGNGTGSVVSSPSGINCPGTCSATFAQGTVVTLTATATGTSKFSGFSGACSSTASCVLTINAPASVIATFDQLPAASTLAIHPVTPLPPFTPGVAYSAKAATADGGQSPYSFSSDTFANGAPPPGMSIDVNGNLVGTPSASITQDSYTFGICVQDRVATRVCTTNTVRRAESQSGVPGTCRGSATITVTGQLRNPSAGFCVGALPLTATSQFEIQMQAWNQLGPQQAVIVMEKGSWICQNDHATPVRQQFAPIINFSTGASGSLNGVGSENFNGGRFDINLSMSGSVATGTISDTYTQPNDSDVHWAWTGTFNCTR